MGHLKQQGFVHAKVAVSAYASIDNTHPFSGIFRNASPCKLRHSTKDELHKERLCLRNTRCIVLFLRNPGSVVG